MDPSNFTAKKNGHVLKDSSGYHAFVPNPLPQTIRLADEIVPLLSIADQKLGNFKGLCRRLPNPHLLSGAYISREAVLSSKIEGTQSTQSDLYLFELDPEVQRFPQDVREVRNYVMSLEYALERRKNFPLSLRLLRETHEVLLKDVRGRHQTPGEFRKSQNWIGGSNPSNAVYVPPPVEEMKECLDRFEKFLHRESPERIPVLIECALAHYQFEAIHPFLDGNGRLGRLLVTLLVIERECLDLPLLYLSAYFEKNRDQYYEHLLNISQGGEWADWLAYFLKGVAEQAEDAISRANLVLDIHEKHKRLDLTPTAHKVIESLLKNPYVSVKSIQRITGVTAATAVKAIENLEQEEVIKAIDEDRKRERRFYAPELLHAFSTDFSAKEDA